MTIDDSFTKPGTVPFKWEIRPGVPKVRHQPPPSDHHQQERKQQSDDQNRSFPSTPQKLRPPPSGFYFQPLPEFRTRSFRSAPRTRSEHHLFDRSIIARPDIVSQGCFSSPLLRRKDEKKGIHKHKPEPDYTSDLETSSRWSKSTRQSPLPLSRWSKSTRQSPLPFCDSPSSSSFSSYQSSPRPVSDAEWAGFGLF